MTSRPACPGPIRTGGPPRRGWRTSPKERHRLAARVKALERDLGTARKAAGTYRGGCRGCRGPNGREGGGGGGIQPVFVTFWPAHRHGMPRLSEQPGRCLPSRRVSLCPCWRMASRSTLTPWRPLWPRSLPPTRTWAGTTPPLPTASCQRRWTPFSSRRWSKAPRALPAGAVLQTGGEG